MATYTDRLSNMLAPLLPEDLDRLLSTEDQALLGCILRLNRDPRYQNKLNAVVLVTAIMELRAKGVGPDRRP